MIEVQNNQPPRWGLLAQPGIAACSTVEKIQEDGPSKLVVVADVNHALTKSNTEATAWKRLDEKAALIIGEESRKNKLYLGKTAEYQVKDDNNKLTPEEAEAWWNLSFDHYVECGLNISDVRSSLGGVALRDGTVDMFNRCSSLGIPIILVSAGIKCAIDEMFQGHKLKATHTIANEPTVDDNGTITGWKDIVHPHNKYERSHKIIEKTGRENIIVIGDSLTDTLIVRGMKKVVRMRTMDERRMTKGKAAHILESLAGGFDLVAGDSVKPADNILAGLKA